MIYIIIALKSEAQAFVDQYKLTKTKLDKYTLYYDADKIIIISGVGVQNAREATQALIENYNIYDEDIYVNIGICGADKNYTIGSLIEFGELIYNTNSYLFKSDKPTLVCVDKAVNHIKYEFVDMESYGFLDAVLHSADIKRFHIFKVVSDHFKPSSVTKEKTKSLIFNVINDINKKLLTPKEN